MRSRLQLLFSIGFKNPSVFWPPRENTGFADGPKSSRAQDQLRRRARQYRFVQLCSPNEFGNEIPANESVAAPALRFCVLIANKAHPIASLFLGQRIHSNEIAAPAISFDQTSSTGRGLIVIGICYRGRRKRAAARCELSVICYRGSGRRRGRRKIAIIGLQDGTRAVA